MPGTLKKPQNNKEVINQQLHDTIYKKVTKKTHNHESPKKNGDGTIKKCIELFKKEANPNVLIELEKSLKEQEESYNYYTKKFLPVLETEVMKLEVELSVSNNEREQLQRSPTRRGKILEIISGIIKRSSNKDHSNSTIQNQKGRRNNQTDRQDNALGLFKNKSFSSEVAIAESSDSSAMKRNSLAKGIGGGGTSGTYKILRNSGYYNASAPPTSEQLQLNDSFSQSCADAVEVPSGAKTSKLSSDSDSDSGINSPGLASSSRRSSLTLATSTLSEGSLNSTLSSTEEDNGLQPKDEGETKLAHLTKTRSKGPSVRRSPSKYHEKIEDQVKNGVSPGVIQVADTEIQREKNMDPDDQDTQKTGSQAKDSMQPEEKRDRKNAITIVQKLPVNKNNSESTPSKKQSNNKNLHVAFVAGCALSTIGCIVAGAMTSGLIGAGLLAMAAVFAIAAVAELHSNFLSSKLTSINVSPLVDDKELTACSQR